MQLCCICTALAGNSGAPSHIAAGGRHIRRVPENGSVRGSHYQNGIIEGNNTLQSSSNDAWKTWTLGKGGLSHFEGYTSASHLYSIVHHICYIIACLTYLISAVAEVLPTERRKLSQHGDIASVQNDVQRSSNGVAVSDYPSDGVGTERDEIHSRLQSLELDLSSALKTLRSRFDKVLSHMVCISSNYQIPRLKSFTAFTFLYLSTVARTLHGRTDLLCLILFDVHQQT